MDKAEAKKRIKSGLALFRQQVKQRQLVGIAISIFIAVISAWYAWWGVPVAAGLVALFFIALYFRTPDNGERILELAEKSPDRVVWIYPMEWSISPYGVFFFRRCYLRTYFLDGHREDLRIPPSQRAEWMHLVNVLFPNATTGYSNDRATRFKLDPGQLKRGAD